MPVEAGRVARVLSLRALDDVGLQEAAIFVPIDAGAC